LGRERSFCFLSPFVARALPATATDDDDDDYDDDDDDYDYDDGDECFSANSFQPLLGASRHPGHDRRAPYRRRRR
jgi:hypothetical protein